MAGPQLVTLLSDLGTTDAYAGIVKGVLLSRAPDVQVIDLIHAAEAGSLHAAAYMLATAAPYFPASTVHLVLTNPGAAPGGRILAAGVRDQFVVAPDNGVAALLLQDSPAPTVVSVENPDYLLPARRHTFHTRLLYAPAAAALARGVPLERLGPLSPGWAPLPHAAALRDPDGSVLGEVVHIDRFGNLLTNIHASQLPPSPRIVVGSTAIDRISDHYGEVEIGGVVAIVGNTGQLEISVNRGSAAKKLFVSRTDPVRVTPASGGST